MQNRLPLVGDCYRSADVGRSITCGQPCCCAIDSPFFFCRHSAAHFILGKIIKQIYTQIDFVNTVNCFTVATLAKHSDCTKPGGSVFLFVVIYVCRGCLNKDWLKWKKKEISLKSYHGNCSACIQLEISKSGVQLLLFETSEESCVVVPLATGCIYCSWIWARDTCWWTVIRGTVAGGWSLPTSVSSPLTVTRETDRD